MPSVLEKQNLLPFESLFPIHHLLHPQSPGNLEEWMLSRWSEDAAAGKRSSCFIDGPFRSWCLGKEDRWGDIATQALSLCVEENSRLDSGLLNDQSKYGDNLCSYIVFIVCKKKTHQVFREINILLIFSFEINFSYVNSYCEQLHSLLEDISDLSKWFGSQDTLIFWEITEDPILLLFTSGFPNLGTTDLLDQITLFWGCPVHYRMFSCIPGLNPLDASSTLPIMTIKIISRCC